MLTFEQKINSEILRIKKNRYLITFQNCSDDIQGIGSELQNLPKCDLSSNRMQDIHKLYKEIANNKIFSLEDVYGVFGLDCESTAPLFTAHKRDAVKNYRDLIIEIVRRTEEQIIKNVNKIDICNLTHSIFYKFQEFSKEKPKYIANMWHLGNSTPLNSTMKFAFERFTRANEDEQGDPDFCLSCINEIFNVFIQSIKDSFKIHYLDSILDHFCHFYFIESNQKYEFLIFAPDIFDKVRDFLLETIDRNPFFYFIKRDGGFYERCLETETCLNGTDVICLNDEDFLNVKCLRDLNKSLSEYYTKIRALFNYGMSCCRCYDITENIDPVILKKYEKNNDFSEILPFLTQENLVFKESRVIRDREDFIKNVVKPKINNMIKSNTTITGRKRIIPPLLVISDKKINTSNQ